MKAQAKKDLPVGEVRRYLEPGPIVLVSSRWKGKTNIMTMGWHMVMETEPSLIGCYIWDENHSLRAWCAGAGSAWSTCRPSSLRRRWSASATARGARSTSSRSSG